MRMSEIEKRFEDIERRLDLLENSQDSLPSQKKQVLDVSAEEGDASGKRLPSPDTKTHHVKIDKNTDKENISKDEQSNKSI